MPMVGVVDPSYTERRRDEPGRNPNWYPLQEVRERALDGGPGWSPWVPELVEAALGNHQERDYISTTALLTKCPRSLVLERKEAYIGVLDSMYASLRGTLIHAMLESSARTPSMVECRFFADIDGTTVSGSPDLVTEHEIYDYKMTENPPQWSDPWPDHRLQGQYNRWLVNHCDRWEGDENGLDPHNLDIRHLVVVYLGPKGPKPIEVRIAKEVTFANGNTGTRKKPDIWSDDQVMDHLMPRLQALRCALDVYPDWPEGVESLWGGPEGWACPGKPWCPLPDCLAKRYPAGLVWDPPEK